MTRVASNTKQKLIETATELIWSHSYGSVSVDEICARAGVRKGSFYHFFPSKADLALATIDWCMEESRMRFDDIFSPTRPPRERLGLLADYIYEKQNQIQQQLGHVCGCPIATLGSEMAGQDKRIGEKIAGICAQKSTYYKSVLRDLAAGGEIDHMTNIDLKTQELEAFILGHLMMARIQNDLTFIKNHFKEALFKLVGVDMIDQIPDKLTARSTG